MDLRSGCPLWSALAGQAVFPRLEQDESCEVAIIGAGITGAMLAWELSGRGVDVVVVDRRDACMGSTAACTALVQYELDRPLLELAKLLGVEHAQAAYLACRRALDDLNKMARKAGCPEAISPRKSLYLARSTRDTANLREELAARRAIGLEAKYLSGGELKERFGIKRAGALLSGVAYEADPVRLTTGLLLAAGRQGARVYARSPVSIELDRKPGQALRTETGHTVRCGRLAVASGYETPEQFDAIRRLCELKSTYAFASAARPEADPWPGSALIWEMGEPYLYARAGPGGRLIVGGEDVDVVEPGARDALLPRKIKKLVKRIAKLFPEVAAAPEYCWAGTFGQTRDGLPYIGTHREYPGCYFALGYGGNGITFSVLASQIIGDHVTGVKNKEARLFGFGRGG